MGQIAATIGDMMDRRRVLAVMGGLMLCPLCAADSFCAETHWSYEGATGEEATASGRLTMPR